METNAQREFMTSFGSRMQETIQSVELVQLLADERSAQAAGLQLRSGNQIFGLFAYGEKNLYFYVHAVEPAIMGFPLRNAGNAGSALPEQIVCFGQMKHLLAERLQKKWNILSLFSSAPVPDIRLSFTNGEGKEGTLYVCTQIKNGETFRKLSAFLPS